MITYKNLLERLDVKKASMGTVIRDFKKSDAPQFAGKSDKKRREMAIAAKLAAEEVEFAAEGRMKELAYDMEQMGEKEFKAKHKKSKKDMQAALGSPQTKR